MCFFSNAASSSARSLRGSCSCSSSPPGAKARTSRSPAIKYDAISSPLYGQVTPTRDFRQPCAGRSSELAGRGEARRGAVWGGGGTPPGRGSGPVSAAQQTLRGTWRAVWPGGSWPWAAAGGPGRCPGPGGQGRSVRRVDLGPSYRRRPRRGGTSRPGEGPTAGQGPGAQGACSRPGRRLGGPAPEVVWSSTRERVPARSLPTPPGMCARGREGSAVRSPGLCGAGSGGEGWGETSNPPRVNPTSSSGYFSSAAVSRQPFN